MNNCLHIPRRHRSLWSSSSLESSLSMPLTAPTSPVRSRRSRMERASNNTRGMLVACLFLSAAVTHCESFTTGTTSTTSRRPYAVASSQPRRGAEASASAESLTTLYAVSSPTSNENGAPASAPPPSTSISTNQKVGAATARKRRSIHLGSGIPEKRIRMAMKSLSLSS
jgi:hypothetical protein